MGDSASLGDEAGIGFGVPDLCGGEERGHPAADDIRDRSEPTASPGVTGSLPVKVSDRVSKAR